MGTEVKKIHKKLRMTPYELVKFQLITELIFFRKENIIPSDIEILTLLAMCGQVEIGRFCNFATKKLYKSIEMEEFAIRSQNIRNRLIKLEKRGFITRVVLSTTRKGIELSKSIEIQSKGNLLLEYNFLALKDEPKTA